MALCGYDANGTQPKKGEFRSTSFYHRAPDTASESCWMREKAGTWIPRGIRQTGVGGERGTIHDDAHRIASDLHRLYSVGSGDNTFPVIVVDP